MASTTKERPINLSSWEVLAFLEGRKRMFRRIVKFSRKPWIEPLPIVEYARDGMPIWWSSTPSQQIRDSDYYDHGYPCQHGSVGERLWVRETWAETDDEFGAPIMAYRAGGSCLIGANGSKIDFTWQEYLIHDCTHGKYEVESWRPSIHMPRWASRFSLEIESVRVERVQEITPDDADSEGMDRTSDEYIEHGPSWCFAKLWDKTHGIGSWERNDWVWVVGVKVITKPPSGSVAGS